MIEIRRLGPENVRDANLPNQPFSVWGKLIPALQDGVWSWEVRRFPEAGEMCFPDCPYDPAAEDALFLGAYDGPVCVGLAVLRKGPFRYLYLEDLKVDRDRRGQGVGGQLIEACLAEARAAGALGISVIGQDNNLTACLFYLHHGFAIGGFDNRVYRGTVQEEKADIIFYRDLPPEG